MAEQHKFKLIVNGTYHYVNDSNGTRTTLHKAYPTQEVILTEELLEAHIGIIKKLFLPPILRKMDPNFKRVRQVFVEEAIPLTDGASLDHLPEPRRVRLMSRKQLIAFIKMKKLPVIPELYDTIKNLRDATLLGLESPKALLKRQAKLGIIETSADLVKQLNPQIVESSQASPNTTNTPSPKKEYTEEEIELLKQEATSLGVKFQPSWKPQTIQKKIDEKKAELLDRSTQPQSSNPLDNEGTDDLEGHEGTEQVLAEL